MSRQNKVNKTNYTQAGRLTPDDMAREQARQNETAGRAAEKDQATGRSRRSGERESSRPRSAPEQ